MTDLSEERLAVLVHEVRSPVAALAAISQTLHEADSSTSERVEPVRLAIAACRAIERLVVDAMTTSVRREDVDLAVLVRETAAVASLSGASVEARVEGGLPAISADPVRLRQALDNLVSNALTHSGGDAVVIVGASSSEAGIDLFVADTGLGIPVSEQERIFEAGSRLDLGRPGSGLGLAIARAIAEAHGGTLTLKSEPGKGAIFTIALPASQPATEASSS